MGSAHLSMAAVIELGLELPNVVESSYYGARALKLNGRMLACTPVNKSAEVNSVVVAIRPDQRTSLLQKHPSPVHWTTNRILGADGRENKSVHRFPYSVKT